MAFLFTLNEDDVSISRGKDLLEMISDRSEESMNDLKEAFKEVQRTKEHFKDYHKHHRD